MLFRNLPFNLIGIAEIDTMPGADIIRTCRDESVVHPVRTEVALPGDILIRVKFNGIVGTFI